MRYPPPVPAGPAPPTTRRPVPILSAAAGCTVQDLPPFSPAATSTTVTFPVIVANTAAPGVTNSATVSGGGEPAASTGNNTTSLTTPVIDFDLTVTKTKTAAGNFVLGVNTATYTIVVNNIGGRASTGTYTVTDTLPAGMTLNAVPTVGAGWTCAANTPLAGDNIVGGGRVVCTRATVLACHHRRFDIDRLPRPRGGSCRPERHQYCNGQQSQRGRGPHRQ